MTHQTKGGPRLSEFNTNQSENQTFVRTLETYRDSFLTFGIFRRVGTIDSAILRENSYCFPVVDYEILAEDEYTRKSTIEFRDNSAQQYFDTPEPRWYHVLAR